MIVAVDVYDDDRVARRANLFRQLAGNRPSDTASYDLAATFHREIQRDFPLITPGDRERIERVIRVVTGV